MYKLHATEIQAECKQSPEAFRDVLLFVLATIQEPLERMPEHMASIRNMGETSPVLWGMKRKGYADVQRNYRALWNHLQCARITQAPLWRERCIVDIVDSVHGIGTAKAGFVMQLVVGAVGCLDSHNLKRFGLKKGDFEISTAIKRTRTKLAKAHKYVTTCDALGGCEFLWDSWCNHVASLRPDVYPTGHAVSAEHLCAVHPF